MAYTATTWVDGTTAGNHTTMNNLETQYTQAITSFEQDLWTPFVLSGLVCTKDGSVATQLDVTAGIAFLKQSADNSLQRRAPGATNFTTSTPSTTYFLYLQADGSWYWSTTNGPAPNSLHICNVVTDGSGNISTVQDFRVTVTSLLSGAAGQVNIPAAGSITFTTPLSSANRELDFQQGYGLWSDNTAGIFGSATSRLWLDAPDLGDLELGPRSGSTILAGARIRALSVWLDSTNSNGHAAGAFKVQGGMTTSLDAGHITTDGNGNLTTVGLASTTGTVDTETWVDLVRDISAGDLIAFYRLDEASGANAADSSGNGVAATYNGGVTYNVAGAITDGDHAVTLNGTTGYINVTSTAPFPTGNDAFSMSVWFNFASNPGSQQEIIAYGSASAHDYMQLDILSTGAVAADTGATTVTSGVLSTGVWHHAVITWDGTTMRLYVDGASVGTPATPGAQAWATSSTFARIGANVTASPTQFFTGSVDEAAFWSVALTATQISSLYSVGHSGPTAGVNMLQVPGFQVPQSGAAASGFPFLAWSGAAGVWAFSVGGRYKSSLAWVDQAGNFGSAVPGATIPTTRNGIANPVPIYTGSATPVNPPTGALWGNA